MHFLIAIRFRLGLLTVVVVAAASSCAHTGPRSHEVLLRDCNLFREEAACEELAAGYARGHFGGRDLETAYDYLTRACELGRGHACYHAGRLVHRASVDETRIEVALEHFRRGCFELNDPPACHQHGLLLADGIPGERRLPSAIVSLERGCALLHAGACQSAAWRLRAELLDYPRAHQLYERACELDPHLGCDAAAEMRRLGQGTTADPGAALSLLRDACYRRDSSTMCHALGLYYESGWGVSKDDRMAVELFKRSCDMKPKSAWGCAELALGLIHGIGIDQDVAAGMATLEKVCGDRLSNACALAASLRLGNAAEPMTRRKAAYDELVLLCNSGTMKACRLLIEAYYDDDHAFGLGSADDALAALQTWIDDGRSRCAMHHAGSCFDVGYAFERSAGKVSSCEESRRSFLIACEDGHRDSCRALADKSWSKTDCFAELHSRRAEFAEPLCAEDVSEASPFWCFRLADVYRDRGDDEGVARYRARACLFGSIGDCAASALDAARNGPAHAARFVTILADACERNVENACIAAAGLRWTSTGLRVDLHDLDKRCAEKPDACVMLAFMLTVRPDDAAPSDHIAVAFRRGCSDGSLGALVSCVNAVRRSTPDTPVDAIVEIVRTSDTDASDEDIARVFNDLAWALFLRGDYARAIPFAEQSLARDPDQSVSSALDTLAAAVAATGDLVRARSLVESGLAKDPANETLRKRRDEIDHVTREAAAAATGSSSTDAPPSRARE